jgi:hypothetical protein
MLIVELPSSVVRQYDASCSLAVKDLLEEVVCKLTPKEQ